MELLVTAAGGGGIPLDNVLNWLVIQTRLEPASLGHTRHITFLTPFSGDQGQVAAWHLVEAITDWSIIFLQISLGFTRGQGLQVLHLPLLNRNKSWGGGNQRNRGGKIKCFLSFPAVENKNEKFATIETIETSQTWTWNLLIVIFGIPHSLAAGTVVQRQLYNVSRFK